MNLRVGLAFTALALAAGSFLVDERWKATLLMAAGILAAAEAVLIAVQRRRRKRDGG